MAKSESSGSAGEVATTIATSTSPGTVANTVALAVVLWHSLPNIFPPLRAATAINLLDDTIKEVSDMYDENKSTLGDTTSFKFETDFNRLELSTLELKEKYIQDCLNVSWASLPCRLSHEKYAWATARAYHRGVDDLKTWLELAIIRAKKGPLQADLETREATAPAIDASAV
ncbi:hypothetical protein EDD85DRAFT_951806 [Armillaria nabsnona]|nr:hypothetical protein EDD85DRAFT_951806 [Armillaria nabsnona]